MAKKKETKKEVIKKEVKPEKKALPKKVKSVPKYKCYRCGYQTDERADDRVCPVCGGRVQE